MIRVAFLGCDSTHTEAFGNRINKPGAPFHDLAKVVSIWGEDFDQAAAKAENLGIAKCCKRISEALKDADFAMVIGRFGNSHFEPARMALDQGIPTFVDKPFTTSFDQAKKLAQIANSSGARLVSSSPLRFARELKDLTHEKFKPEFVCVSAPANCTDLGDDSRFQSPFFYGIHGVEVLLELMGDSVRHIDVMPGKRVITVQIDFADATGAVQLVRDADEFYAVHAYGQHERRDLSIALDGSYYPRLLSFLFEEFYPGLRTISLQSTLHAIEILEEAERTDVGPGR